MTKVVALVIIAIVLLASVPKPYVFAASAVNVKVGIYYYVWYGNGSTGLGTAHWNDSFNNNIVDTPDIGFYDSNSNVTLYNQLKQMTDINISFVLISWWGAGNFTDPSNHYIDNNAKKVFQVIKDNNLSIQAAILFEPFNQSSGEYNFPIVYDYIYDTFVTPFQSIYFHFLDKPLIVLYNQQDYFTPNGTYPEDDRFTTRISGHQNYTDWVYWSFDDQSSMPQPYSPKGQPVCKNEEIDVCPRYDDSHQRSPNSTFDVTYEQGYYAKQWSKAITEANSGNVTLIMISTWNEYHERTQIEPCNDSTSAYNLNSSYIYDLTSHYRSLITVPEFSSFLVLSLFMTVTVLASIVYRKKHAKISGVHRSFS
jgi:hypothetical protein